MPKIKRTSVQRKAGSDADRVQLYKEARAIIGVAALSSWRTRAPNYYKIATSLGLRKEAADVADEIWNDANGPDEGPETEEHALARVQTLLEMELDK